LQAEDFEVLGLDPKLRPENLSPSDYARIARAVAQRGGATMRSVTR